MSQSLSSILVHVIFSTKNRIPLIHKEIEQNFHSYIVGIAKEYKVHIYEIGGIEDHIHILISLPRTMTISKFVEEIKKGSSKWIKTKGAQYRDFSWQNGYGAFSIGYSNFDALRNYIQRQREHHKKMIFQDEMRLFLKKYRISFDEKYLWD